MKPSGDKTLIAVVEGHVGDGVGGGRTTTAPALGTEGARAKGTVTGSSGGRFHVVGALAGTDGGDDGADEGGDPVADDREDEGEVCGGDGDESLANGPGAGGLGAFDGVGDDVEGAEGCAGDDEEAAAK